MTRRIGPLVTLLVTLGMLAPLGPGALAAFGLADGRVMVICTGDGLRTIRIGDDGQPADLSETADFCALSQALDTARPAAPVAAPFRRIHAAPAPLRRDLVGPRQDFRRSLPRAPPAG